MALSQRKCSQKILIFTQILVVFSRFILKGCTGYVFQPDEGYLEGCDFEAAVGSGPQSCDWYSNDGGAADWILTNQPILSEFNAGLTTDHTPTGNGYYWVARRTGSNFPGNRAFLEFRVRGFESKIMNLWYHMSGDVGSMTVEIIPIYGNGLNYTAVYSIQGNQARQWQRTSDIPIAECDDYRIRIEAQLKGIDTSIAVDDIEFRSDGRLPMEPSPTVPRDEVCWNDGEFILSIDQHHDVHCCCAPGFSGVYCQTNIDECITENGNSLCAAGSTCLDLVDGFSCRCKPGFSGTFCDVDEDDCVGTVCERGGVCEDRENDYHCVCPTGYEGKRCEREVDDCVGVQCRNGATCVDGFNTYFCDCVPGFEGTHCDQDKDECLSDPCGSYAACTNTPGSFWCLCPSGLQNLDGTSCTDTVDSCASGPCQYGSECVDKPVGFDCRCREGTTGDLCEVNENECRNVNCQNDGICNDGLNSYTCDCKYGYDGRHCEINLRDSFCRAKCDRYEYCTFDYNQTECRCLAGYTGSICSFEINECNPNPCVRGTCEDSVADYTCTCDQGWTGKNCDEPLDFCSASNICGENSECVNTIHGAVCVCDPGYTGFTCRSTIDICDRVQCMSGGECVATGESGRPWYCACDSNHVGKYCEVEVVETADGAVLAQAQEAVCMHFWSLPSRLKGSVLAVCVVALAVVIIIGALTIECSARSMKRKHTAKSSQQQQYPFKFYQ